MKNIVGIGIDYWKLIAKKAGLKYIIVKADNFSEVLKNIENKTYDVNMATSRTLDKQIYSIFSDAYEKFPIAIATLKTKKFIINGVELEGKKVAVGKQYSTYFLLKNVYPKIDFVLTKNIKEALKLVQEGKVFAAVDTEPVLKYQIILNNFNNVHITGITGVDFNLQIMIRDDYKILQRIINKAIDAISNQERIDIYKKWMGLRNESKIDYEFIFQLSLFFLIIIFLLAFAYIRERKLQNRIKQLNANLEKKIKIAIEENKKQQIIMMQQSRLAQMGEIISMIAHQWRQPLNGLSIITQTIFFKYKKGILDDKAINEFEKYIKKQVKHMSETIDYFRDFFKPEKEKIDFCINSTIQDIINILKPVFERKHIKITFDSPKIINYHGYQNELGQSIMNILNNSKDAFLESKQENRSIKIELQDTENRILIILEDNAGGIKDEILPMIFDPYFSTKSKKNGTGLGLYMSKIVIEDHFKGQIIASNIKNGAKFTISLPKK